MRLSNNTLISLALGAALIVSSMFVLKYTRHTYIGDEPHYLVMANSLISDGDVDLRNDYTLERYRSYYNAFLDPHLSAGHQPLSWIKDHAYSIHSPALPALLAVPIRLLGTNKGATATAGAISLMVLLLTFAWAKRVSQKTWVAWVAVIALATAPYFVGIEGFVFPDVALAGLLLGSLLLITGKLTSRNLALLGVLLGSATWFHFKALLSFTPLGLAALIFIWKQSKTRHDRITRLASLIIPWFSINIIYELKLHEWYNVWNPSKMFPPGAQLGQVSPIINVPAMLFDASKGLFTYNPAFWLILVGLPIWYVVSRRTFIWAVLAVLPGLAMTANFSDWTGGYAPNARYLMEVVPVLMPAIALVATVPRKLLARVVTGILLAVQAVLSFQLAGLGAPVFDVSELNPLAKHAFYNLNFLAPHYNFTQLVSGTRYVFFNLAVSASLVTAGLWLGRNMHPQSKQAKEKTS